MGSINLHAGVKAKPTGPRPTHRKSVATCLSYTAAETPESGAGPDMTDPRPTQGSNLWGGGAPYIGPWAGAWRSRRAARSSARRGTSSRRMDWSAGSSILGRGHWCGRRVGGGWPGGGLLGLPFLGGKFLPGQIWAAERVREQLPQAGGMEKAWTQKKLRLGGKGRQMRGVEKGGWTGRCQKKCGLSEEPQDSKP